MAKEILLEKSKDGVILTLNRPEKLNAFNWDLLKALEQTLDELETWKRGILIITGAGDKAFCAGADLKERFSMSLEETREFVALLGEAFSRLEALQIPTIAAINGVALGGGLELALACDLRVIDSEARVGLTEVQLGIIPGAGGTQRLAHLIGIARAKQMVLLGERISAQQALHFGLVNQVTGSDQTALGCALQMAESLAQNAPLATQAAKKALQHYLKLSYEQGFEAEKEAYEDVLLTKDREEGLKAFMEKRPPRFVGQ